MHVVQAAALLSAASCSCCNDGGDPGGPPEPPPQTNVAIASVEIIPNMLAVPEGTTFNLRARVKDQWGNILPDSRASVVKWSTIGEVSKASETPGAVTVQAVSPISPTPKASYVVASVDGVEKSDSSRIVISAVPEASNGDWLAADYAGNSPPSYALLTGPSTYGETINRVNDLVSFVKEGALENFACDPANPQCGSVTLFQPGKAITQVPIKWKSGCDYVGFMSTSSPPTGCIAAQPAVPALTAPWTVKVAVFTLASKAGIDNQVKADVAYAQSVFAQPLLGIALTINVTPYANRHVAITHGLACKTTDGSELTSQVAAQGVGFTPQVITVVYVDAINPGTGDDIGFTCPFDDVHIKGTVIFVSADAINNSTLAHELGHALGQWHSGDRDHPDVPPPRLAGFDPSNLMWSSESDWGVSLRRNLTLGQLFQMSFADFSFIKKANISPAPGLKCSTDAASNSPCPPLAKDPRQ